MACFAKKCLLLDQRSLMASKEGMLPNKYSFWIECASTLEEEYSEKCSNSICAYS